MKTKRLIVGLGNPGKAYKNTRHNIGFEIVEAFAAKHSLTFRSSMRARGKVAKGSPLETEVVLLLPKTYMNLSGLAVKAAIKRFGVNLSLLLIVADDIALPFGRLRLRDKGSAGGHNGLKSIENELGSQNYPRLRVGISDRQAGELGDYVLEKFSPDEQRKIPDLIQEGVHAIELWMKEGIEKAMQQVNPIKLSEGDV